MSDHLAPPPVIDISQPPLTVCRWRRRGRRAVCVTWWTYRVQFGA